MSAGRLLVVDDERPLLSILCETLVAQGFEVLGCSSPAEALEALKQRDFDLMLTDLMMPGMDGIALLRQGLEVDAYLTGIIMTGQGTVQTAVDAMKVGAFDYILKPFKLNALLPVIGRAMDVRRLKIENLQLRQTVGIYELGQTISYTLDLKAILDKVADGAMQQCDADEASILLPAQEGTELQVAAVRGKGRDLLLGQRLSADKHVAGWVAHHREPLVLEGRVRDPRFAPAAARDDIHLAVSLPFMVAGKLAGILNLNFTHPRRSLTLGELKALGILATIAGTALESARLHTEVRLAEEKYRSVFENAVDGIFQTRPDGGAFTVANAAMARILGYETSAALIASVAGIDRRCFVDPDAYGRLMKLLESQDAVSDHLCEWTRADGNVIWVSLSIRGLRAADGMKAGYEGTMEDVTARKQAEQELARERNLLRTLIDNLPDSVFFKDTELRFVTTNASLVRALGAERRDEVVGRTDFDFLPQELAERFHATESEIVRSGKEVVNREESIDRGGVRRWVLNTTVPLRDAGNTVVGIVGVSRDITERKSLEIQLLQAQKMEAVGQLAGGVAHDFNNILTAIIGYATFLQMGMAEGDPLKHNAEQIIASSMRAARLTQSLLAFSRKQVFEPRPVDLNGIMVDLEKLLVRLIGEDIQIKTLVAAEPLIVMADSGQIEQVLMNLVTNARDAMPDGGSITISASSFTMDREFVETHGYGEPGPYALLSFEDTGTGMDRNTQDHVFEPFFTTKDVGKGTGLGLSIVYGIVKQHKGHINVYSEIGGGTTFRIYLPIAATTPAPAGETGSLTARGTETVLVVEDDPVVRTLTRAILEQGGYTVIEAQDGDDALRRYGEHREAIRLVLLDIVMPKRSGKAVADEIWKTNPGVRVLFTSGYTFSVIQQKGVLPEGMNLVTKPFSPRELLRKVRKVLDA